jgi:SAM-dependent methyltransferase
MSVDERARNSDEVRAAYDQVADEYARRFVAELDGKPLDRGLLAAFADEVRGKGPVLDVGCGPGHIAAHVRGLGLDAGGLDLSPAMIDLARRVYPGGRYEVGDMMDLGPRELAGIVALYAICHVRSDLVPRALASMFQALAPGGLLLVSFHAGDERIHLDEWWGHTVSIDFWLHVPDAVCAALENAGFVVEAGLERRAYTAIEHPSRRAYFLARKPSP